MPNDHASAAPTNDQSTSSNYSSRLAWAGSVLGSIFEVARDAAREDPEKMRRLFESASEYMQKNPANNADDATTNQNDSAPAASSSRATAPNTASAASTSRQNAAPTTSSSSSGADAAAESDNNSGSVWGSLRRTLVEGGKMAAVMAVTTGAEFMKEYGVAKEGSTKREEQAQNLPRVPLYPIHLFAAQLSQLVYKCKTTESLSAEVQKMGLALTAFDSGKNPFWFIASQMYQGVPTGWLVFRGTQNTLDCITNASVEPLTLDGVEVHGGFAKRIQNNLELIDNLKRFGPQLQKWYVVGHSLGGGLAMVMTSRRKTFLDGVELNNVEAITFAAPGVFFKNPDPNLPPTTSFVLDADIVPRLNKGELSMLTALVGQKRTSGGDSFIGKHHHYLHGRMQTLWLKGEETLILNPDPNSGQTREDLIHIHDAVLTWRISDHYLKNYIVAIKKRLGIPVQAEDLEEEETT